MSTKVHDACHAYVHAVRAHINRKQLPSNFSVPSVVCQGISVQSIDAQDIVRCRLMAICCSDVFLYLINISSISNTNCTYCRPMTLLTCMDLMARNASCAVWCISKAPLCGCIFFYNQSIFLYCVHCRV